MAWVIWGKRGEYGDGENVVLCVCASEAEAGELLNPLAKELSRRDAEARRVREEWEAGLEVARAIGSGVEDYRRECPPPGWEDEWVSVHVEEVPSGDDIDLDAVVDRVAGQEGADPSDSLGIPRPVRRPRGYVVTYKVSDDDRPLPFASGGSGGGS